MAEDLEELRKLVREKNISTVEDMQNETSKFISKIPNLKEKYEKIVSARGYVLEPSTTIEIAFNELLTKTGGEDIVIDNEKKELYITSGIKKENELGGLSFEKKAKIVKEIIIKSLNSPEELPKPNILDDFEKFVAIRNIFAHVPINWLTPELEFNTNFPYKHFFKLDPKWKDVSIAFNEFMAIQKEILEVIPRYIHRVLIKKKIISTILLGANFGDIPEDDKEHSEQ